MKVLLTGFTPFGNLEMNPSQVLVEEIAARMRTSDDFLVIVEVLPTEFEAAGQRIQTLIRQNLPDVILGLGVATERSVISLERIALNLDDTAMPDNTGLSPRGTKIVNEGPLAYATTLPIDYLQESLEEKGIPVEISNHAGTYVCNHTFYLARHQIEELGLNSMCGFIHLPLVADTNDYRGHHTLTLFGLVLVIEYCLELLKKFYSTNDQIKQRYEIRHSLHQRALRQV